MKTQLRLGSDQKKISAISFSRAYLLVQKQQNVPGAAALDTDLDLTKLRISIDINQAGVEASTSFDAVGPTMKGLLSTKNPNATTSVSFANSGTTCAGLQTSSADMQTLDIPLLDNGYILKGGDYVTFNIDIIPGFFSSTCDTSSSVYLIVEPDSDVEQLDMNLPVYYPITADKNSPSFTEDAVSEIKLLNSARYALLTSQPFASVEVISNHCNDRFDSVTLEQLRWTKETQLLQGGTIVNGSNSLYDVEPSALTDVQINCGITTTAVSTGANFVYVSRVVSSPKLVKRAIAHNRKVAVSKAKRRGMNV